MKWIACLLLCASLVQAQPATSPSPADRNQQTLAFYHRITVEAYQTVGRHDPKWDDDAHLMLEGLSHVLAMNFRPDGDEYDDIFTAAKRVHDVGCTDPLVLYAMASSYTYFNRKYEDVTPIYIEAAQRMEEVRYHPLLKCMAALPAATLRGKDKSDARKARRDGRHFIDVALTALPAVLADRDVPPQAILGVYDMIGDASRVVERDRAVVINKAMPLLEQAGLGESLTLTAKAHFLSDYAADAKHDASQPAEQDEKLNKDRLTQAAAAGEQAWQADHANIFAAIQMMQIQAALGDQAGVETWFQHAVSADASSYSIYAAKLQYLEPKWQGSTQKMIDVGRQCAANPDMDSGIPLLLVDAHIRAACYTEQGEQDDPQPAYFTSSPQVWNDIQSVYEPYVKKHSDSLYHVSRYAQLACWCGQWKKADQLFKMMGDQFSLSWFRSKQAWQKQKLEAAERAK